MLLSLGKKHKEAEEGARVELCDEGLRLRGVEQPIPLLGGSVEYVHLAAAARAEVLDGVSRLGLKVVAASVPWSIHELEAGSYAFEGARGRYQRDLGHFLEACMERGLFVWLRIGPAVGLELEGLGLPRRVLDNGALQARGPRGEPVIVALPPAAFAAPSYASQALLAEAGHWLRAAAAEIAPYRYPEGPVVAVSIDDKASFFFRTAAYDQDYHPDAVAGFAAFVEARHGDELPQSYGHQLAPPRSFDAKDVTQLSRHLDWLDYKEQLLGAAIGHFAASARAGGLEGIPLLHGAAHADIGQAISLTALQEQVHSASYDLFALRGDKRQTRRALRRARANSRLSVVGQLQWGAPSWWAPPSALAQCSEALTALMHGARGLVFHSLAQRDRWIDAPLSSARRPAQAQRHDFTQRLVAAIADLEVLKRSERVEVAVVDERALRQLSLLSSLVAPLSPLALSLFGLGAEELCDDRGLFSAVASARDFERSIEQALLDEGRPFDLVEGESGEEVLGRYRALIVPCADVVDATLWPKLERYVAAGGALLIGPRRPRWDRAGRALDDELLPAHDLVNDGAEVLRRLKELGLEAPSRVVEGPLLSAALRCDPSRRCEEDGGVLLVANETSEQHASQLSGCQGGPCRFWDAFSGTPVDGRLKLDGGRVKLLRCRPASAREEGGAS